MSICSMKKRGGKTILLSQTLEKSEEKKELNMKRKAHVLVVLGQQASQPNDEFSTGKASKLLESEAPRILGHSS